MGYEIPATILARLEQVLGILIMLARKGLSAKHSAYLGEPCLFRRGSANRHCINSWKQFRLHIRRRPRMTCFSSDRARITTFMSPVAEFELLDHQTTQTPISVDGVGVEVDVADTRIKCADHRSDVDTEPAPLQGYRVTRAGVQSRGTPAATTS